MIEQPQQKEIKMLDLSQTRNVVKANTLVMARYKLTTIQQKIVILLLSEIDFEDESFSSYAIPIKNLLNALEMGNDGKDYFDLKASIKKLMGKVVDISKPDGSWLLSHWVYSTQYDSKTGIINFKIDPALAPFLLGLKKAFTSYERKQVLRLSRSYSIRLYEIMAKNRRLGGFRIELSELRLALGIDEKTYARYYNFKVKVLEPARKELEEKTNIKFSYNEICQGRRIINIEFIIEENNPKELEDGKTKRMFSDMPDEPAMVEKLKREGLKESDVLEIWTKKFDYINPAHRDSVKALGIDFERYVDEKIFIFEMKKKKGNVDNAAGFLIAAIRDNYQSDKFEEELRKKDLSVMRASITELEERKERVIRQRDEASRDILKTVISDRPGILEEIAEKLLPIKENGFSIAYNSAKPASENYKSPIVKGIIDAEIKKSYPEMFDTIGKTHDSEIEEIDSKIEELERKTHTV